LRPGRLPPKDRSPPLEAKDPYPRTEVDGAAIADRGGHAVVKQAVICVALRVLSIGAAASLARDDVNPIKATDYPTAGEIMDEARTDVHLIGAGVHNLAPSSG
jgi:hypothetical protein